MQTQLKSFSGNWSAQLITLIIVVVHGVFQLGLGAAYIDVGSPFSGTALSSLFASSVGVKAVGGYLIVAGLMLMTLPLLVCYNLAKNKVNKTLSAVSWATSCIVVMFIFTSAVLAAQLFNPASKHLNDLNLPFSFYGTKTRDTFKFALTDAIMTFTFGFFSALYLFIASSYHRERVESDGQDEKSREDEGFNQPHVQDNRVNANMGRNTPPRSIDLDRDNYAPGDVEKRMGSIMYKDNYNFGQNQAHPGHPSDQDAPHFNQPQPNPQISSNPHQQFTQPQSPRSVTDNKRSKSQFSHSEPDFNMEGSRNRGSFEGRQQSPRSRRASPSPSRP